MLRLSARCDPSVVIPANAGIQRLQRHASVKPWVFGSAEVEQNPAFAGMTASSEVSDDGAGRDRNVPL
ncbi:hypothetical protein bcgnr5380_63750 [Bacillus cereus]